MTNIRPENFNFLIGAAKSGTVALFNALQRHSGICSPKMKELQFFSLDENYARGVDYYLGLFPDWDATRHRIAIDASASYSHSPKLAKAAGRIHEFNPSAKLIYLVRNPYERIRSHNQMFMTFGNDPLSANRDLEQDFVDYSRYYYQLSQYRRYFPKDALLVLTLDQMVTEPGRMLSRIFEHLGLPPDDSITFEKRHSSDILYSMYFVKRVLKSAGDIESDATTRDAVNYFNNLSEDRKTEIVKISSLQFGVSDEDKERFKRALRDDMNALADEYGIDVAAWGF